MFNVLSMQAEVNFCSLFFLYKFTVFRFSNSLLIYRKIIDLILAELYSALVSRIVSMCNVS